MNKQASTLGGALRDTTRSLEKSGIQQSSQEARMLLCHLLNFSSVDLISQSAKLLEAHEQDNLDKMVSRRLAGVPINRIIGSKEIYGLEFKLSKDVLEPRSDTESLIDVVLADHQSRGSENLKILDIGTGSGAIIISLLHHLPKAHGVATDVSANAIDAAKANAVFNKVDKQLSLVQTSWCEGIAGKFDVIVSNPPYIQSEIIATLSTEVKDHDPALALDGGSDGLVAYRQLLDKTSLILENNGKLYLEIGYDQAESVSALAKARGWQHLSTVKDLGGNDRVLIFERLPV